VQHHLSASIQGNVGLTKIINIINRNFKTKQFLKELENYSQRYEKMELKRAGDVLFLFFKKHELVKYKG
jgi:hypothetical protein